MIRAAFEKAATVAMVAVFIPIWALAQLLESDNDPPVTNDFDPDEPDRIDYRPTETTLERAADLGHKYIVRMERRVSIDLDRFEEWVDANYDDEAYVRIMMSHGSEVYVQNTPLDYECPVCGVETSLLKASGGTRKWIYTGMVEAVRLRRWTTMPGKACQDYCGGYVDLADASIVG